MRSRLVILVAVVIAAIAVIFAASRLFSPSEPRVSPAQLPSTLGSYLGVYEAGTLKTYQPVADFTKAAGKQPNLVGYYSGWGEPFETSFAETVRSYGAATIMQWDPTLASVSKIAAGGYDSYLRSFADSVRDFGHPVVIGFGHEMNASWYSWGYKHVPAATFVAAWRHIVTLFRKQGADNVTWLWTLEMDQPGTGPIASWWPGAQYVSWVGIDGYYYHPTDTFASVFGRTITQVRKITNKPVLLAETAVGPRAGQFAKIQDLFHGIAAAKTLGLVWFDKTQHGSIFHQDWRLQDNQFAVISFRLGVRDELTPFQPAS